MVPPMRTHPLAALLLGAWVGWVSPASGVDFWAPARDESVVEILTTDSDGDLRETPVWIVVLDDAGYVRTNDSTWLANIRRGSPVRLRVGTEENAVRVSEVSDAGLRARVEDAFKQKYGWMQRVMSALRTREPTVLLLAPRGPE
jgi:hypothetical protein